MPDQVMAGLALSSNTSSITDSATYHRVTIGTPTLSFQPPLLQGVCPAQWSCSDIGDPTLLGSQSLQAGIWTIQAAGTDIWNDWDQFHYAWQTLPGDGGVSAQIVFESFADTWGKAGVMLRQNTDAGSQYYAVYVTSGQPNSGVLVESRENNRLLAVTYAAVPGPIPIYLKVARTGNSFSAYTSTDGIAWKLIPGSTFIEKMQGPLLAGIALTSHNPTVLSTAKFEHVRIQ
jgi:hypothetical protein